MNDYQRREYQKGQDLQALAQQIAQCMGFEWSWTPPESDEHLSYARIAGPEGSALHLRSDWSDKGRLSISGCWPPGAKDRTDRPVQFIPYRDDRPKSITCAKSRGPQAIAKDIFRRYLPAYLAEFRRQLGFRYEYLQKRKDQDTAYHQLAQAAGKQASDNGKLHLGRYGEGPNGTIEVSTYRAGTCVLELRDVPIAQAVEIVKLLQNVAE